MSTVISMGSPAAARLSRSQRPRRGDTMIANVPGVPSSTPLSHAISKDLKARGFPFVGSTIVYAYPQATGLVHEAYLKLVDQSRVDWQGRTHFKAVAAKVMRRVLVDHARKRGAQKRDQHQQR